MENGRSEVEKRRDELGLGQGCQWTAACGQVESRSRPSSCCTAAEVHATEKDRCGGTCGRGGAAVAARAAAVVMAKTWRRGAAEEEQ
jgi:hypothetical protein